VTLRALVLLLLTVAACWPAWSIPDLDGTEGRRAQIALEMLQSGDWMVPTLGGEPTWAKPPLHYWLLCLGIAADGMSPWAVRLPSVLAAWLAALLAAQLLRARFGELAGWIGGVALACGPLTVFAWPTAEIDPIFASLVAASIWTLACGFAEARTRLVAVSGALAGFAFLQKGPPFFLFAAGAYAVWWRHARMRGAGWHFAPFAAVVLAYFVPLWLFRVDPKALLAVANDESVGRFSFEWGRQLAETPQYLARALGLALPFALFARSRRAPRGDGRDVARAAVVAACVWAAVGAAAALTFSAGRPTRYLLPNVPLLAFALAPATAAFVVASGPPPVLARRLLQALAAAAALATVTLPFVRSAPASAPALTAVVAVGAWLATTRARVVALILALPLAAAWTVGIERAHAWPQSSRARGAAGATLRAELDRLGVDRAELSTSGHFDSPLLLAAGLLPPGDENGGKPWRTRWVLREAPRDGALHPPDYALRYRLDLPFKSFLLCERVGAGK
jgi:4-amino-4-deoxy-L-arabinose transferase-like glycosyltransferase